MNDEILSKILEGQGKIAANIEDLKDRVDSQGDFLKTQGETLLRNTITVEEHHKRSTFLEEEQKILKERIGTLENKVEQEKAVKSFLKSAVKWVGYSGIAISSISGILIGIYELAKRLGL